MSRFYTPLIALLLGVLPFFLFLGATNTTTLNGEVIADDRFNLLGLVMAIVGLVLVYRVLRPSAPNDGARKGLAAVAGLICAVQLANSADLVRIEPLDWIMPDRNLPALQYAGLSEDDRIFLSSNEPETYVWALRGRKGDIMGFARQHAAYADLCHGGRYRIDLERAEQLPDYFSDSDLAEINRRADGLETGAPTECTDRNSNRLMGETVDTVNRSMDLTDRLEAEYLATL